MNPFSMKRHKSTIQESAWTISNILAGNHTQIQIVIDAGCLQPLIDILVKGDFNAQKEAAWAVLNLTTGGTVQQIAYLCEEVKFSNVVNEYSFLPINHFCRLLASFETTLRPTGCQG